MEDLLMLGCLCTLLRRALRIAHSITHSLASLLVNLPVKYRGWRREGPFLLFRFDEAVYVTNASRAKFGGGGRFVELIPTKLLFDLGRLGNGL